MNQSIILFTSVGLLLALQACTTVTIDEYVAEEDAISIESDEAVVVLGRRHSSNYETEPSLIECVADVIDDKEGRIISVIDEDDFLDSLYPWFEPRTAPLRIKDINRLLAKTQVAERIQDYKIRYMIWIDGKTETTDSSGSIGCSIGAGGGGCFGFGTWDKESDYEATIWDFEEMEVDGKISADAEGTSYMPAIVVPIPLIARVQNNACKALGAQLRNFLNPAGATASVN
jgi:hypothetical protein